MIRFIGKASCCGTVVVVTGPAYLRRAQGRCPEHLTVAELLPVRGKVGDRLCDARCTGARSRDCECQCGGANHAAAHLVLPAISGRCTRPARSSTRRFLMSPDREPTAKQVARGLVLSLIEWELSAADGESMTTACERFGADVMQQALADIQEQLRRAGVRYLNQPSESAAKAEGGS